ncbi:MAG: ABC transporter ATP-binding protein [Deltaproteobacteria bacterium]|nr:ABC transporter ATP-binding protein [Deltaproteobacteria bacterium]MCL5792833.1 ABC transporter ATP-binding protein [Deltaproteobacteria bacterium]
MIETPIKATNLRKSFGDFVAVDDITLSVEKGEVFGFLGPNGAGKTTTVKMLCGLLLPSSGSARVAGFDIAVQPDDVKSSIGYMSQKFSLYSDLSVSENIDFFGNIYGIDDSRLKVRKKEIIKLTGLEGREQVITSTLSAGWKQRLALGCSIIHEPRILFLDEPTAGVDPDSRRMFWDLIYSLAQKGMTMFVTTHYMDEAENCTRLGFIYNGKMVASGTPLEIKRTQMKGIIIELDTDSPSAALKLIKSMETMDEVSFFGRLIHAVTTTHADTIEPIIKNILQLMKEHGVRVNRLNTIPPSLEDIFISLIKQEDKNEKS